MKKIFLLLLFGASLAFGQSPSWPLYSGSSLPSMVGQNGKFLHTNGTTSDWAAIAGGGDMLAANNLSDVVNKATGRTNLGVAIGTNVQAFDAELSLLAGLTAAANKGIMFTGAGSAGTFDLTAAGLALLDDADATAQRVTLGLVIGTNVQAYDAELAALAGLTSAANQGIMWTGAGTAGTYSLTAAGLALLDDADAAAQRTTLGLVIGTNVQAQNANLTQVAGLADPNAAKILFWNDTNNAFEWLTVGANLTVSGTTLDATGGAGGVTDGDKGDITVGTSGTVWTIDNGVITNAKLANVSTNTFKGRVSASTGVVEDLSPANAMNILESGGTNIIISSEIDTTAKINALAGDDDFATLNGNQSLANKILSSPIISGPLTLQNAMLYADAAMGANAVDVGELANTKTISADTTFTFSSTPSAGTVFGLVLTNSDSASHTITIPSSFSDGLGVNRTTFSLASGAVSNIKWRYNGTSYTLFGEPVTIADLVEDTTPSTANDFVETWDASAGAHKKVKLANLPTGSGDDVSVDGSSTVNPNFDDGGDINFTYSSPNITAAVKAGAVTLAKMANMNTSRIIGRQTAGSGVPEELTVAGGLEFTAGGIQRSALTGAVTSAAGSNTTAIANDAVALGTQTTGNYMSSVAATSNETSVTHTPAEGSTATIGLAAAIDLSGKTYLKVPNAGAPTVDQVGKIAEDTDYWAAGRGAYLGHDGTAQTIFVTVLASDTPTNGQVPTWNTGGTVTWETPTGGGAGIENEAFGFAWNGDTTNGAAKDNIYDWGHVFDTDDDGKVNVLDAAAAGLVIVDSSGVVGTPRTITGTTNEISVSQGDGQAGNPTISLPATVAMAGKTDVTVPTATAGDSDTSAASTAFVQAAARDTLTGTHASPSTTTPLSPTWNSVTEVVYYGATGTINLPAAAGYAGRSVIIYNTGAFVVTIDSNASEVIVRDGTAQTGGVSMTLSSGAGNYVALICDGVRWITLGYKGTLAAGS